MKLFDINKKKKLRGPQTGFLRVLEFSPYNNKKISFVMGGSKGAEQQWEGDWKPVISFLACDEMTKVNHSNIPVKCFPFWNFSLPADNQIISLLRPHLHFFEPNNGRV